MKSNLIKSILFFIGFISFGTSIFAQNLNQPANWPNSNWTIGGTYVASALFGNPTVGSANFAFDDDAAGTGSADNVYVESPVIDLTSYVNL